ncbi:MAG: DUF928 domain-containing protein [Acaryochloris sp. SU_5_25]|nr:DUF928 domain-containing protein [Acaryochloris sp. SU_5_25]
MKPAQESLNRPQSPLQLTGWLTALPLIFLCTGITPVPLMPAESSPPQRIAQATAEYDNNMRQGYKATAKRDYRKALIHFRRAEQLRPGNRYARIAIQNVSLYVSRGLSKTRPFIVSGSGAPINRVAGGTRGSSSCFGEDTCLIALLPERDPGVLRTALDYPVLLFHLPKTAAQTLEFRLFHPLNHKVYKTSLTPPAQTGIISIDLSNLKDTDGKGLPPLEYGKSYGWDCSLILDSLNRSKNLNVEGSITRETLNPNLEETLKQSTPVERLPLYAANNLWYDLIATLYQQRRTQPNNADLSAQWTTVLKEINLDKIAQVPLF